MYTIYDGADADHIKAIKHKISRVFVLVLLAKPVFGYYRVTAENEVLQHRNEKVFVYMYMNEIHKRIKYEYDMYNYIYDWYDT